MIRAYRKSKHRDLGEEALQQRFRQDLLYRIRVARVRLPALRERRDDLPLLARAFLAVQRASTGKEAHAISDEAMALVLDYRWPGNVRALRNAVEYAVIRCRTGSLSPGRPGAATSSGRFSGGMRAFARGRKVSEPEAIGLLALMVLQESRRQARCTPEGDLVLLEDQDRSLWDAGLIAEGKSLVERALSTRRFGAYILQAAIAAVHAGAPAAAATDWPQIVALYDALFSVDPSPVVELNRAVAVAMRDGPERGLALVDAILQRGDLGGYHLAHAARADFCRRPRTNRRGPQRLRAGSGPCPAGTGAAVPGPATGRVGARSSHDGAGLRRLGGAPSTVVLAGQKNFRRPVEIGGGRSTT